MTSKRASFVNGEYYHIFNRGIARQPVFLNHRDYEYFLQALDFYRFLNPPVRLSRFLELKDEQKAEIRKLLNTRGKIVEVLSFVIMPNHYHVQLKQLGGSGISTYLSRVTNSYTRYHNIKNDRMGDLFQGVFKSVWVETEDQLLHLSRYIHLNPLVSGLVDEKGFASFPWSSYKDYVSGNPGFVNTELVLSHFGSPEKYQEFVLDQLDYARKLDGLKHLNLE